MPLSYWAEAFHTATYLINRLPTRVLQNVSPYHRHVVFYEHFFPFKDTIITPPLAARSPSAPEVAIEIRPPPPSSPLPPTPQPAASSPPLQTYCHALDPEVGKNPAPGA
ncbi:hypothetical protein L3X38_034991 [Prunus dulcis]|uniref:Transposable element protein n=1 Tax=Prunus dulcis TaxID=3755 RepID=A0AAD4VKK9_PRUDU|nr:hypothetical protein L3X38_034991 [Prunus dulcis]